MTELNSLPNTVRGESCIISCRIHHVRKFLKKKIAKSGLHLFNSSPNDKILAFTNLKAFADEKINVFFRINSIKINVKQKLKICFKKSRKHCGKRRKCRLSAFSSFPTMFSKAFFLRVF